MKTYEYYYLPGEEDTEGGIRGGYADKGEHSTIVNLPPEDGKEMTLLVQDPDTLEAVALRGIYHKDWEKYPDADCLLLKTEQGFDWERWAVEVIKEAVDDESIPFEAKPHGKVAYGGRKGRMLADMLRERDAKIRK